MWSGTFRSSLGGRTLTTFKGYSRCAASLLLDYIASPMFRCLPSEPPIGPVCFVERPVCSLTCQDNTHSHSGPRHATFAKRVHTVHNCWDTIMMESIINLNSEQKLLTLHDKWKAKTQDRSLLFCVFFFCFLFFVRKCRYFKDCVSFLIKITWKGGKHISEKSVQIKG